MTQDVYLVDNVLYTLFPGRVRHREPLALHSSARVGGPADIFLDLQSPTECDRLVRLCAEVHVPLLIIGNGSNVLFPDQGVRGIVARMGTKALRLEEQAGDAALAIADAGLTWTELIDGLARQGWGGLDFGYEIPGTLGGAIVTNAGFHNEAIGQYVQWVEILDARGCNAEEEEEWSIPQTRRYARAELQFGNRQSRFREQQRAFITTSGQLIPGPRPLITPPEIILRLGVRVRKGNAQRRTQQQAEPQQPVGACAGQIGPLFKDPGEIKAGQLIEQIGGDAWWSGAVQLSPHDANFLVNRGGARAADIIRTMIAIHQQVLAKTGIHLEVDLEVYGVERKVRRQR